MVANNQASPQQAPVQQQVGTSDGLNKAGVQETWWAAWWTTFDQIQGCSDCNSQRESYYRRYPKVAIWGATLLAFLGALCLVGVAYSAYRLARVSPSIIYYLYTFVKSIVSYVLKGDQNDSLVKMVKGGLAQQFGPVVQYARASQLKYLDQQAAQWIKETCEHIISTLTTKFVQVCFMYHLKFTLC